MQRVLYEVLKDKPFQTILSSHSTHVTSKSNLPSLILLTNEGQPKTKVTCPGISGTLSLGEIADLERYLDATRSALFYARKVILVEGPAELFVIPPLVKKVMGIDIDRFGVSIIPIYGVHFGVYAKLFNELGIPKKCAIIADGDLRPSDSVDDADNQESLPIPDISSLTNEYIGVFRCRTTFERALTMPGLLLCLASAAEQCGAPLVAKSLIAGHKYLQKANIDQKERKIYQMIFEIRFLQPQSVLVKHDSLKLCQRI